MEAWAAGTVPIVFQGSGGAAEIVEAADAGIVYESQDGEILAGAIEKALALSQQEQTEVVRRGRAWIDQNCNVKVACSKLDLIMERIVRH
jgi:glycosyltransferase involved in cell wall biosynthesis